MPLVVGPSARVAELCADLRPVGVVSLTSPGHAVPEIDRAVPRLVLVFNDITGPRDGLVAPTPDDIAAILTFGRGWDGQGVLLVHCLAGISRSTAAALMLACQREPDRAERDLADALRAAAPCATPNPLMIALADERLGRGGRLVAAVLAIGRGAEYRPYRSFALA